MEKEFSKGLKISFLAQIAGAGSILLGLVAYFLNQRWLGFIAVIIMIFGFCVAFFGVSRSLIALARKTLGKK